MAVITGYTSLQTAVADYLNNSTLTTFLPNFIQNWEERFYRDPKNFGRWMETSADSVIASDVVAVPASYLKLKYAYVSGSPSARLDRVSINQLLGTYPRGGSDGTPVWIAREGSNFLFGPEPDFAYTIHLIYFAKQTLIRNYAGDAAAHWLILNAPEMVLYGALLEAEPFLLGDARVPLWKAAYDYALQAYRDLFEDEEVSGAPVQEVLA